MNIFAVMKHFDPMFGRDVHIALPPGSPTPTPPAPHLTTDTLMGKGITVSWDTTVFTHFGWSVQRGSDIGPFIAHIPLAPNTLVPLIMLASASKSEWGSQQYLVKNKPGACALLSIINPNLNCCDPVPMPLDFVLAITTHFVGMTWGEIVAGALMMVVDIAVVGALNYLGGAMFDRLGQAIYERALFKPMFFLFEHTPINRVTNWFFQHGAEEIIAKGFVAPLTKLVGMDLLGGPVGYSFPINAFGFVDSKGKDNPSDDDSPGFMERAYDAQRDAIDNPSVPTHDVPPDGAEGAGGMADAGADGAGGANGVGLTDAGPTTSVGPQAPAAADAGPNMSVDPAAGADAGPSMSDKPGMSTTPDAGSDVAPPAATDEAAAPAAPDEGPTMSPNPGPSAAPDEGPNMSVDPGSAGSDDPEGER